MSAKQGLHEVRTRVTCHLPVNDAQEEKAFFKVIDYLDQQRQEQVGVKGYTHSEARPAAFHGYWWRDDAEVPLHDQIVLCLVDYLLPSGSQQLSAKVKELKQTIRKAYRYYKRPQDEVWVVAQQILRED
ncbi:MAG: hypothetical protein L0Z62_40535 [Gemmataceae bacterium]|nr:hypothetical protein [Gemmataceae bacterium]